MLTVRTSENTVITSFRLITERQDFSSVRTGENTVRARARIHGCLFESWCNHYDSDCNNGESFDCYGLSLFTLEQMSQVCEEIKDYIGKLKHASIPLEEQSEILRWSENYSSSPTEAEIKEANSLLVDFLEQYCELTEGIMSLCPDCEYISIMGP